jgi:hypothetical protein
MKAIEYKTPQSLLDIELAAPEAKGLRDGELI